MSALLRGVQQDYKVHSNIFLGRAPTTQDSIQISTHKSMPRKACHITLNQDQFTIHNTSAKKFYVDRLPLPPNEKRTLQHKSLIQIADQLFFFLMPNDLIEKRKRHLKERRKQISQLLQTNEKQQQQGQIKGLGKRMSLDEILSLWELTRQEVHSIIGQTYQ